MTLFKLRNPDVSSCKDVKSQANLAAILTKLVCIRLYYHIKQQQLLQHLYKILSYIGGGGNGNRGGDYKVGNGTPTMEPHSCSLENYTVSISSCVSFLKFDTP